MAGWLQGERSRQRATIAQLEQRLEAVTRRDQALEHAHAQLEPLRSVVTSAGMRACPLRPWGERPQQPWARAVVYFDGDHHQSYLVARDLEPCRQGSRYVLWFLVDGKPVPGGSFQAQKGEPVALSAEEVPDADSRRVPDARAGPGGEEADRSADPLRRGRRGDALTANTMDLTGLVAPRKARGQREMPAPPALL